MTLKEAIKVLVDEEHIGDFVYDIKERAYEDRSFKGNSWDHPRVKRFSDAVAALEYYNTYGEERD